MENQKLTNQNETLIQDNAHLHSEIDDLTKKLEERQ